MSINKYFCSIKPEIAYAVIATFFGILLVFTTPPFFVQDEMRHFFRAYQISDGHVIGDKRNCNLSLEYIESPKYLPRGYIDFQNVLVRDKSGDIYVYGFKDGDWRYTKLNQSLFANIQFLLSL